MHRAQLYSGTMLALAPSELDVDAVHEAIGHHGIGKRNEKWDRILNFCNSAKIINKTD